MYAYANSYRLVIDWVSLQDVRSNREECDLLKRRLLELLAVVTMAMQKQRTTTSGKASIPTDLKQNVERLLE